MANSEAHTALQNGQIRQNLRWRSIAREGHGALPRLSLCHLGWDEQNESALLPSSAATATMYDSDLDQTGRSARTMQTRERSASVLSVFLNACRWTAGSRPDIKPVLAASNAPNEADARCTEGIIADQSLRRRCSEPGPSVNPSELLSGEEAFYEQVSLIVARGLVSAHTTGDFWYNASARRLAVILWSVHHHVHLTSQSHG